MKEEEAEGLSVGEGEVGRWCDGGLPFRYRDRERCIAVQIEGERDGCRPGR